MWFELDLLDLHSVVFSAWKALILVSQVSDYIIRVISEDNAVLILKSSKCIYYEYNYATYIKAERNRMSGSNFL